MAVKCEQVSVTRVDVVDLRFPVVGDTLPVDHGYALYGALSKAEGGLHEASNGIGIFPIPGAAHEGRLAATARSALRVRTPLDTLPALVALAGQQINIAGSAVRLGVPTVHPLRPASVLVARLVIIKTSDAASVPLTPERFLTACQRQLDELEIAAEVGLPVYRSGPRAGEPRRRVMRIQSAVRVGYAVQVAGLTADESLRLQVAGLGGRRRMGCGLFLPARGA